MFKQEWGYEPYLDCIHNKDKHVLLTKFRIGICFLHIETGRYEPAGRGQNYIDASLRYCLCCNTQRVEDEFYFLIVCPVYNQLRTVFLGVVRKYIMESTSLAAEEKSHISSDSNELFKYIMGSKESNIILALVQYLCAAFKCRENILVN